MKITGYVTHMIYRPKTHYKAKKKHVEVWLASFERTDFG